jgi:hypothetical protein
VKSIVDKYVNSCKVGIGLKRTNYKVSLVFNALMITEVIIDQHYKLKHPEVSDQVILKLIIQLHNLVLTPSEMKNDFLYFKEEPIFLDYKPYRLVFVMEKNKNYLGVINAFRIQEKQYGISIR